MGSFRCTPTVVLTAGHQSEHAISLQSWNSCQRGALRRNRGTRLSRNVRPVRSGPEPQGELKTQTEEDDELWIEKEMRKGKKKKKGPTVIAPQVEKAYGKSREPTAADAAEALALQFLGLFFVLVLVDGLFIALAGFLPEAADQFAETVLYPTFSPVVVVFLLCSSAYGLWKSRQG